MEKSNVLDALAQANVVKFGEFTLVSGEKSPIYVDLRMLPSYPWSFDVITTALAEAAKATGAARIGGMETAGIPLGAAMAIKLSKPMIYIRKKPKEYGTQSRIEGVLNKGESVILVDDLMTRGTSKLDFVVPVREAGGVVKDIVIVLDREQGGKEALAAEGIKLHNLVTLKELLAYLFEKKKITKEQYYEVLDYLSKRK
jgi:orotate phosphoribosyltransferase